MSPAPRVFSIPAGVPFLPTLADALVEGRLVSGFSFDGDPLTLAQATIYVPTRRAARALRAAFVERLGGRAAILPVIRPLGEFDEDMALFETGGAETLALAPPIPALDRVLLLSPLVQGWKRRLPAHLAALYGEEIVVPASFSDAVWLARDLGRLMDEIETEGAEWAGLAGLAPGDLANWWQVTLEFLDIVTRAWPDILAARDRSNPAAHRNAGILAEADRIARGAVSGPVIAAGSTGSIPATAKLLAAIARLPQGAVVLPGLDRELDEESWGEIGRADGRPASFGHPQAALKKLAGVIGVARADVEEIAAAPPALAARMRLVNEALRPAETTDLWPARQAAAQEAIALGGLDGVSLIEAANQREEALAIAAALRLAIEGEGASAALVTGDRELARRVSAELARFAIHADDSGGTPLAATPPATLAMLAVDAVFRPGDPVAIMALVKHPLLRLGLARPRARAAAETVDLVMLRGGAGRPDAASLAEGWEERVRALRASAHRPFWLARLDEGAEMSARALLEALSAALSPLVRLRGERAVTVPDIARATVEALEALARAEDGGAGELYGGDNGEALADFLRALVGADSDAAFAAAEWPDVLRALMASETVKPTVTGDARVAIWGTLEARLQHVGTLVLGGLNEGSWPRRADSDRFMSRMMKAGLDLEPPERRIGQAAHDFFMALGVPKLVLSRSARVGDAPAAASRWLQRLDAFMGEAAMAPARARGAELLRAARALDAAPSVPFAPRPCPKPPLDMRPRRFSVTEIETLRRDAYAVYARHVLRLAPVEPLMRDPGAADRGSLFHDILHAFAVSGTDPAGLQAEPELLRIGRQVFDRAGLPADVDAVWWPRFARLARGLAGWERGRADAIVNRRSELAAAETPVGASGVTLRGRADRIDELVDGKAAILDFKTGSYPSKRLAHVLIAPQLALEGALLMRGSFAGLGAMTPAELSYVRLKADGEVVEESVLKIRDSQKSAADLSRQAWERLEALVAFYADPQNGYLSRALPFREGEAGGDYDHLARVLEWSAGGTGEAEGEA